MKKLQVVILMVIGLGVFGFGQIDRTGTRQNVDVVKRSEAQSKINRIPLKSTCGDLSAKAIEYQLVRKSTDRTGVIKVVATVKNVANFPFRVKEGKGKIRLVEVTKEGRKTVKGIRLKSLKEGKQITLVYTKRWYARSKSIKRPIYYEIDIDYPSSKTLQLTHNDCKMSNNIGRRTTHDIDALFAKN